MKTDPNDLTNVPQVDVGAIKSGPKIGQGFGIQDIKGAPVVPRLNADPSAYTSSYETAYWNKLFPGQSQQQIADYLRGLPQDQSNPLIQGAFAANVKGLEPDTLAEQVLQGLAGAGSAAGVGALGWAAAPALLGAGGAGAGAGAGGGVAAGEAGALGTAVSAGDIAALTAGAVDTGAGAAALGGAADAGIASGLAGLAGSLPADAAAAGAAGGLAEGVGGSAAMLPEQTVTAASTAGSGGAGVSDLLGSSPLLASLGASPGSMTDIGQTLNTGQPQFLSANDFQPSMQTLPPDVMQSLGIDPASFAPDLSTPSFDAGAFGADNPGFGPMNIADPTTLQGIEGWLSNPKNAATAGMLGLSLKSALSQPKLPGALGQANANAAAETKAALPVIQSGGTAGPEWASQKSSIDATIDQQIQQQSQALQQAAANSGMGGQNSGVVQQQIAEMTRQANVQRQQLYAQAQQQNVQNALAELSGGDQTLTAIGATQLQQSEQAQALAAQTAELALLLQSGGGYRYGAPGP